MDRGSWWAIVHGVTKSQTRLNGLTLLRTEILHFDEVQLINILCIVLLISYLRNLGLNKTQKVFLTLCLRGFIALYFIFISVIDF